MSYSFSFFQVIKFCFGYCWKLLWLMCKNLATRAFSSKFSNIFYIRQAKRFHLGLGYWLMSFLEHLLCILWYSVIVRHRTKPSCVGVFYTEISLYWLLIIAILVFGDNCRYSNVKNLGVLFLFWVFCNLN